MESVAKPLPSQDELGRLFERTDDGRLFWNFRPEMSTGWNTRWAGKEAGYVTKQDGRRKVEINGEAFYVHRVIWKMLHGTEPQFIDHADSHSPGNNTQANLRPSTRQQNNCNRSGWRGRSLPKGVHETGRRRTRYVAQIGFNHQKIRLGTFDTIEEAQAAYRVAASTLHGQFARFD